MSDEMWMEQALLLAQKAFELGEVPVGALLVHEQTVVGQGWNQPISQHDPTAHAEIQALRAAGIALQNYRLPDTTLYVTIEPCTMCLGAIIHARVKRVVYGALEPKAGVLDSHALLEKCDIYNHTIEWTGGVLEDRCTGLIQSFFKMRRQQHKDKKKTP